MAVEQRGHTRRDELELFHRRRWHERHWLLSSCREQRRWRDYQRRCQTHVRHGGRVGQKHVERILAASRFDECVCRCGKFRREFRGAHGRQRGFVGRGFHHQRSGQRNQCRGHCVVWGTVVLRSDGTIIDWNFIPPPGGSYAVPVVSNIVSVAAGYSFGFALRAEGTLVGWGGSPYTNVPAGLNHVAAIACGTGHTLALKDDGTVVSWGGGFVTNVPSNLTGVVGIAAGFSHSLALKTNGTVV